MNQIDFVGGLPPSNAASVRAAIARNTRPSAAEEKAQLLLELGRMCQTPPQKVCNGSVNLTREWVACQKSGKALCLNTRASVVQLGIAIKNMQRFL